MVADRESAVKRSDRVYAEQFNRVHVDPLRRLEMDRFRMQLLDADDKLFSRVAREKKVDGSKTYTSTVRFYQFDDGWYPSSKSGEDLKSVLQASEK